MHEPNDRSVQLLLDAYLELGLDDVGTARKHSMHSLLTLFSKEFGAKRVRDVKPIDFLRWLKGNPSWKSAHSRRNTLKSIKAVFNWGVRMDVIDKNPIQFVSVPAGDRRRPVSDDEFQILLRHADPVFRRVLVFLRMTGCRPGELASMRWPDVDWAQNVVVLRRHKTVKKTGKPRVLYLTPVLVKLLRWLECRSVAHLHRAALARLNGSMPAAAVNGSAPAEYERVFLSSRGHRLSTQQLAKWFHELRQQAGLPAECHCYGLRHAFATNALKRGVSIKLVAELLGHYSVRTTEYYTHASILGDSLQSAARQATKAGGGPTNGKDAKAS